MEKLRQALKTLSEAEKQLRVSNDRITWLTAALLQLAPDQQYMLPVSSADTSLNHSPLVLNGSSLRHGPRKSNAEIPGFQAGSSVNVHYNDKLKEHDGGEMISQQVHAASNERSQINKVQAVYNEKLEAIWLDVLEKIPVNSIREFMYQEGKLVSVSYGAGTFNLLYVHIRTNLAAAPIVTLSRHIPCLNSVQSKSVLLRIANEYGGKHYLVLVDAYMWQQIT